MRCCVLLHKMDNTDQTQVTCRLTLARASAMLQPILDDVSGEYATRILALSKMDPHVMARVHLVSGHDEADQGIAPARFVEASAVLRHDAGYVCGVLLVCTRMATKGMSPAARELNGCYIDASAPRWVVGATPPVSVQYARGIRDHGDWWAHAPVPDPAERRCVTHADDATRLTAAADASGRRRLYTTRWFHVEDTCWSGAHTFEVVLTELLAERGVAYPGDLDPDVQYTFFVHHGGEYHPFEAHTRRVTLGEAVHTKGVLAGTAVTVCRGAAAATVRPGVSAGVLSAAAAWAAADPVATKVPGPLCHPTEMAAATMWTCLHAVDPNNGAQIAALREHRGDVGAVPYGFVVHTLAGDTVFVEGILKPIRMLAYERIPLDEETAAADRLYLHALYAQMQGRSAEWLRFFPHHQPWFRHFDGIFQSLIANVCGGTLVGPAAGGTGPPQRPGEGGAWTTARLSRYFVQKAEASPTLRAEFAPGPHAGWKCMSWLAGCGNADIVARHIVPSLVQTL